MQATGVWWPTLLVACSAAKDWQAIRPEGSPPQWVDITSWPCALDDAGDVQCWTSASSVRDDDPTPPPSLFRAVGDAKLLENQYQAVLTLDEQGRYRPLHCEYHALPVCRADALSGTYLAVSTALPFGIRADDHRLDYPEHAPPIGLPRQGDYFQVLDEVWLAGIDGLNQLQIADIDVADQDRPLVLPLDLQGIPENLVTTTRPSVGGCVLDNTQTVVCVGALAGLPFEEGRWSHLSGGENVVCGARSDDGQILCVDNDLDDTVTLAWGPIRELAALRKRFGTPLSVCAITERNEILCHGPDFDEPFFAALDAVNAERRTPLPPHLLPVPSTDTGEWPE